ncbi:benzoate transporter [Chryseobacterium lactis]|uniref:Benzoate transporter n=1 Tax=Chryseobacterium lactis TaxID=1241981 RepID=A0A3G6RVD6_CHRLC|nr:SMI1/KNR4 family protein [Chryseobacterium lactis]AZA85220.1 SMI1/KNR4 family protein [Chryseobacterium lactis]AZB07169.1 SMI1/KNR4 family protein [Chryseobacterium lactis]PNW12959.1 benzoate transporter [Chryseobacterium lactis]
MENILQKLDINLRNLRPEFYNRLKNSLNDEKIKKLESRYHIQIPIDLKAFYQWKNGQESSCYDAFVNNSMFIPLDEALDTAQELTSMIGTDFEIENWWNKSWIPIFHNGGGDYICYDLEGTFTGDAGQILEFWNKDDDRNIIAGSLESFLNQLNDYYKNKANNEWDDFFTLEDKEGFPKRFTV